MNISSFMFFASKFEDVYLGILCVFFIVSVG